MTASSENSGGLVGDEPAKDRFPVGMRVLAVDDDLLCLKVLRGLLEKCQYHVTTTNQSTEALRMLRENGNKFDLVISDVSMPDMDGFKLLELVGLELDLPVIMLSSHSDTELVMKGISHGACDYLLKPVRILELKNIWQHVIRRKKFELKDQSKSSNQDNDVIGGGEGGQGATSAGNSDQNGKSNKKRKDQIEDDEDEGEEDENDEDPSSQKKPRVVWSVELHKKFVVAVNQLGIEKAVPKKILDLMNVEGITRENVASHLQKYRLYLKRISSVASQQANMVAALGGKDSPYMRIGSLEGFGDFRAFSGSGRVSNSSLSGYPAGGMLGRLNSSAGLGMRGITSSGLIQPGPSQLLNNSTSTLGKIQLPYLPGNQAANLFQGIPSSLEINQLQQNKCNAGFSVSSSYPDTRATLGCSSNSLSSAPNNPFMLQGHPQQTQIRGEYGNQSIDIGGVRGSSTFLDHNKNVESWQNAVQLQKFPSNPLPLNEPFSYDPLAANLTNNINPQTQNIPIDLFSNTVASAPLEDSRAGMQCQTGLFGNMVRKTNYTPNQRWEEQTQNFNHNLNHTFSGINSGVTLNSVAGPLTQSMDQRTAVSNRNIDSSVIDQFNGSAPTLVQHNGIGNSNANTRMGSNEGDLLEHMQSNDGFIQNSYDSLEDLMSAMIKREQNDTMPMDGEFGFDSYSLGSCL